MEGDAKYHGAPLKADQYKQAMAELGLPDRLEEMKKLRDSRSFPQVSRELKNPELEISPGEPKNYGAEEKLDNRSAWGKALAGCV